MMRYNALLDCDSYKASHDADTTAEFQSDPVAKAAWETRMRSQYPIGAHVRVTESDESEYVGLTGTVLDYDVGSDGDWPLIGVGFDAPPLAFRCVHRVFDAAQLHFLRGLVVEARRRGCGIGKRELGTGEIGRNKSGNERRPHEADG